MAKIPEIRINKHPKSELISGECITRRPNQRRGIGYFIIMDSANPTKIHHVSCSYVNGDYFKTKVIEHHNKNGDYSWVKQWHTSDRSEVIA